MKKVREFKSSYVIAILFLFVFGSFGLSSIPKTYSKFVTDGALVYKTKLYNMYTEKKMEPVEATMETAKFEFTFIPNKAIASNVAEWYDITIPDACTFGEIKTNATISVVSKNTRRISYTSGMDRSKENKISMTCKINLNEEYIAFDAKINEVLDKENRKLAYIKYVYKEKVQDYLKRVEIGIENPKVIPNVDDLYERFIAWITAYARSVNREAEILPYVKNTYPNKEALISPNNYNALAGFKIEYNSSKDEYTFTILENFVGYARMYHASMNGKLSGNEVPLYFSTTDRNVLNEAFKNYLNLYVYPKDVTTANKMYKYVSEKQGIYSVIFYGNKGIPGLELVGHNNTTLDTEIKLTKDKLLAGANEQNHDSNPIAFNRPQLMLTNFGNSAMANYPNLGKNILLAIREKIKSSITKNATHDEAGHKIDAEPVAFTDYYIQEDGNRYLIIKVSSDGKIGNIYRIDEMYVPSGMTISFENTTDNKLKANIAYSTKDSVTDIVSYLNAYFKASGNVIVTSNTNNSYAIEYTISK